MGSRHRLVLSAVVLVVALALPACSSPSGDMRVLEENLAAQELALEALRSRVTDLGDAMGNVRSTDPMTGLSQLSGRVEEVVARLDQLDAALAEQTRDTDATASAASTRFENIEGDLGALRQAVEQLSQDLRRELTDLRRDLDQLRMDFESHSHPEGGSG